MATSYHYKLSFGGYLGANDQETWQCGVKFISPTNWGSDVPGLPSSANLLAFRTGALRTWFTSTNTPVSSRARLIWVKVALLKPDGTYYTDPVIAESGADTGVTSTSHAPPQSSLVVTLFSGSHLGASNYSRIYLPWFQGTLDTNGALSAPSTSIVATTTRTMLQAAQTLIRTGSSAGDAVLGIVPVNKSRDPKPVNVIRVGNYVDTQRRRRNGFKETYYGVTF